MTRLRHVNVSGLLALATVIAAWQLSIEAGLVELQYLPAPTAVFDAGWERIQSGDLLPATLHTFAAALAAWAIAVLFGVTFGTLIGLWRPAHVALNPSVEVLRTLPVVAFVPVAALILGLSSKMEIAVAAWAATWPILVNTVGGIEQVPSRLHEVASVFRMGAVRRTRTIILPAAAPLILVGARLGLSFALIVAVVAEMIGNPAGLGHQIVRMQQALQADAMFAGVLVIGLLGIGLNAALMGLSRSVASDMFDPGRRT